MLEMPIIVLGSLFGNKSIIEVIFLTIALIPAPATPPVGHQHDVPHVHIAVAIHVTNEDTGWPLGSPETGQQAEVGAALKWRLRGRGTDGQLASSITHFEV
jgi:hypothetical protein